MEYIKYKLILLSLSLKYIRASKELYFVQSP